MHNHYFVLSRAAEELSIRLQGTVLKEAFSQNKNEVVFEFGSDEQPFFLRVYLYPEFQSFYLAQQFSKARGQVFHCFHELWGKTPISIKAIPFDRCLLLTFENEHTLILKLYGRRSNLILHRPGQKNELYHRQFEADQEIAPTSFPGRLLPTENEFSPDTIFSLLPIFNEETKQYLLDHIGRAKQPYAGFLSALQKLSESPIQVSENPPALSLLPIENSQSFDSALEALEYFNKCFIRIHFFQTEKKRRIQQVNQLISKTEKYLENLAARRKELESRIPPSQLADIIMANLHAIPPASTEVELLNFYTQSTILIKLKKDLSPQKYAEQLYRKSKNEKLEYEELDKLTGKKKLELEELHAKLKDLELIDDWKELRAQEKEQEKHDRKKEETIVPYNVVILHGWEIRIGRNARSNDELTQRYSHKDDLWLHAKDVSGSHVLIKYQSGKNFPKNVIERAAELAAWYSKRKNDSLCPVIVTPKKFVRKKKGAPEGSVIVEKEEVILVVPKSL